MTNAGNIYGLVKFVNTNTDGTFIIALLFAVLFIMILGLKRYSFSAAVMVSSFFCFILSFIFAYIELANWYVVLFFLAVTAFGVFIDSVTQG